MKFPFRVAGPLLLLLVAGLASIAFAIPFDPNEGLPRKDGVLPWKVPNFLRDPWRDGTLGWVTPDFRPWETVKGRNGHYYGQVGSTALAPGGAVYALSPQGVARAVYRFPHRRNAEGTVNLAPRLTGEHPTSRIAIGQDGALYGAVGTGGVFGYGLIYKVDLEGRYQVLHHLEKRGWIGEVRVAENGDVFAALSNYPGYLLRLSKDGRYHYIPLPENHRVGAFGETVNHEILLNLRYYREDLVRPSLWRLNANDELEKIATVELFPNNIIGLIPLPTGDLLYSDGGRIMRVSPAGELSVVHAFAAATEGVYTSSLAVAQDGGFVGLNESGGVYGGGTLFKVGPDTNTFTQLQPLPTGEGSLPVAVWMATRFPLRVAVEKGNLPPMAKDDVVAAATVKAVLGGLPQKVVPVLTNDTDRNGDLLSIESAGQAEHGTVAVDAAKKTITYTAHTPIVKADRFRYTVTDGKGGQATAQVIVRANPAGRFAGEVFAVTGPTAGALAGSIQVSVTSARTLSGTLQFEGKTYSFTARLNEFDQAAALPLVEPGEAALGVQLSLRTNEEGVNSVHAVIQRQAPYTNAEFAAECALVQ